MRKVPLVDKEIYHVFNHGIEDLRTFVNQKDYLRAIEAMKFYQFSPNQIQLSYFLDRSEEERTKFYEVLKKQGKKLVANHGFCLIPNHFHFLLKQNTEGGISKFMADFQNSFTRYFNTKYKRKGVLFLTQFKAVHVETTEQLLHLLRYIHLNPYSSGIVKNFEELKNYPWSSLSAYLNPEEETFCETEFILNLFKDKNEFQKFILNHMDYQRDLNKIKHLVLE